MARALPLCLLGLWAVAFVPSRVARRATDPNFTANVGAPRRQGPSGFIEASIWCWYPFDWLFINFHWVYMAFFIDLP